MHTVSRRTIAYADAARLVELALDHAAGQGWTVAAAVCDTAGAILAFGRHDDASATVGEFALDKAWTAATLRRATSSLGERMTSDPKLAIGMANRPRACAWEGGLPLEDAGEVVGGMGVSGAQGHEDVACIRAALANLEAAR